MKKYYQTLSKEKKKEVKKRYIKEYAKTDLDVRLTRLLAYSIVGYVFALIILLSAIFLEENKTGSIIISVTLFIVATVFIVGRYLIKLKVLNKIALNSKRK